MSFTPHVPPFPGHSEMLTLAMLELARERGVHDMTIRTLAATLRAAPGTLTYHHGDKDTMFATCARFLAFWLQQDLANRLTLGSRAELLPDPAADGDYGEQEHARRLRVWIQLSSYSLNSSALASVIRAGEERLMDALVPLGEEMSRVESHARWALFKSVAMALLQPDAGLSREEALTVLGWAG